MGQLFLHHKPPAYFDGWTLCSHWTAGAASVVAPFDHGPELVFPVPSPGPAAAEHYTEAIVELLSPTYRLTPEHKLRLRLRRLLPGGDVVPIGPVVEQFRLTVTGWDVSIPFDSPAEQAGALGYWLHVEGPWGINAVAGALRIVRVLVDTQPAPTWPGDVPP